MTDLSVLYHLTFVFYFIVYYFLVVNQDLVTQIWPLTIHESAEFVLLFQDYVLDVLIEDLLIFKAMGRCLIGLGN